MTSTPASAGPETSPSSPGADAPSASATPARGARGGRPTFARRIAVAPIVAYRRWVSPALAPRCRYHPSCSRYAVEAIEEFGILRGLVLATWRLLRCNPWSHGGLDPVDAQRLFPAPRRGA